MNKLKHSKMGITSFCVSLIPIIYIIIQTIVDIITINYKQNEKTSMVLLSIMIFIASISFILGIISIFQKGTRKSLPITAIIISCLILLIPILGSMKIIYNKMTHKAIVEKNDVTNISFTPEIQVVAEDFSLRKGDIVVKLNMSKNELLKSINVNELKNATERNVTLKNKNYKLINYNFQGLSITLSNAYWDESDRKENDFVVKSLETTNSEWETYRGITAGGDINKVESVYGKLIKSEGQSGFAFVLAKDTCFLNFVSSPNNKQKIGRISMSN